MRVIRDLPLIMHTLVAQNRYTYNAKVIPMFIQLFDIVYTCVLYCLSILFGHQHLRILGDGYPVSNKNSIVKIGST